MKKHLQLFAASLLAVGLSNSSTALAEGSKQLTPNTNPTVALTNAANTRAGFLTHDAIGTENVSLGFLKPASWNTTALPFKNDYRMYIRLKPNETLAYGVHRLPYGSSTYDDLILTVRYGTGDGTIVKQNTLTRDVNSANQAVLNTAQDGVVASAAEALAGPRTLAASGYRALTYINTTGQTQDFYVEFTQVGEYTNSGTQPGFNDLKTVGTFTKEKRSEYDFWDFTVVGTDGQEKTGRLSSRFWAFTAGESGGTTDGFQNRLSAEFKMYPLVESKQSPGQYYVKEVELAGMRPLVFFYVTNEFGSSPIGNATDFATRRKSQTSNTAYAQYPNFVNNPDPELWPSAPVPTVSVTPQPFCRNGVTQVAFTTTSAENGQFDILIDLNGTPGYQANSADVLIFQPITGGSSSTVVWNGLNGQNVRVNPTGQEINFQFTSNGAAFNFPVYDAEGNPDGFRVRNVRPANGTTYDRLYWDDSNLSTTRFPTPQTELAGQVSTNGVHIWGVTSNDGDTYTVNTWTYGFAAFAGTQGFTYISVCDNDRDGVTDDVDVDDDNDGILDVVEAFSGSTSVDPSSFRTTASAIAYLDAGYVHPVFGAFLDTNNDGVNDYFDTDRDGIPNHFDLDSDGDGLPDAFEANGNTNPTLTSGPTSYTIGNGNGAVVWTYQSLYDANQGRYVTTAAAAASGAGASAGVSANGLPDAVETSVTRSVTGNGNSQTVTASESGLSKYVLTDNDNDQRTNGTQVARNYNFLDIDSDNDGITDNVEAQTTAGYRAPSGLDSDKDGLDNAYDPTNGTGVTAGTLLSVTNTEGDAFVDMLDTDSDNDNANKTSLPIYKQTADWTEGFDTNGNGTAGEEILAKAKQFAANNPAKASYYAITTNGAGFAGTTLSIFLQDANSNGIPNFLEPGNASYHDDNFNGLVDIYDPAYGGAPSIAPKSTGSGLESIFRSNGAQVPLPVTLVNFQVQASGADALVRWTTAQELNSASFDVERSNDGVLFVKVGLLAGKGNTNQRTDYKFVDLKAGIQAATLYYRLRQHDLDGKVAISDVKAVTFDGKGKANLVGLYPNPITAETMLDLTALPVGNYTVDIMGVEGRKLVMLQAQGGKLLPFPSASLAQGIYLVKIYGNNLSQIVKVIKE